MFSLIEELQESDDEDLSDAAQIRASFLNSEDSEADAEEFSKTLFVFLIRAAHIIERWLVSYN